MPISLDTHCAICGAVASHITLLAPGERPEGHGHWEDALSALWEERYSATGPRIVYAGIEAGSGIWGTEVSDRQARLYREILGSPLSVRRIRELQLFDDAGVCVPCAVPYCAEHWGTRGDSSLGTCPNGHHKSLDPY